MKTQRSNFAGIGGLCFLGVLILISAYLSIKKLTVFLGLVTLLCLISLLWAKYCLRKVEIKADKDAVYAFPGEKMQLQLNVSNDKAIPLVWLKIFCEKLNLPFLGSDLCCEVKWLMPFQKISFTQQIEAKSRGYVKLDEATLVSGDGFGISEQAGKAYLEPPVEIIVYPAVVPVDSSPIKRNLKELERAKSGYYKDNTLLKTMKPYEESDSVKDINWRQLAKSDEILVNVKEKLNMKRVCFIPDLESFVYEKKDDSGEGEQIIRLLRIEEMEQMISTIASLILSLSEQDVICTLAIPNNGLLIPEAQEFQVTELLVALAKIDYKTQKTELNINEIYEHRHLLGQMYLFKYESTDSKLFSIDELDELSIRNYGY